MVGVSVSASSATRTIPASITDATVTSGGSQSCLSASWGRTVNTCSTLISVDFSGGTVVDNTNAYKNWAVEVSLLTTTGYPPNCISIGLDTYGNTYWSSGYYYSTPPYISNGPIDISEALSQVWVPSNGYSYVACSMSGNSANRIDSIELTNP
jgi:hypothetical protein